MWFYLTLLSAATNSISTIAHRTHGSSARPVELAWWSQLLTLPFSAVLVFIEGGPYFESSAFILPTVASAALCSYAGVLMFSAYKYSDASIVSPLGNLLPIGLILSSFVMFHSLPPLSGFIGIGLVFLGVYYTSVNSKHHLLQPFYSLWHQRGSRAMLGCVILWSVSTNFDKIALETASAAFFLLIIQTIIFTMLSMYLLIQPKQYTKRVWKRWKKHLLIIAGFTSVALYFQMLALSMAPSSSYVFAVKSIGTLMTIALAGTILHEKHILKRFKGAFIAVIGIVILYTLR